MPIFFNLESHLWIAYLLFFNGLLICLWLRSVSLTFADLTRFFESLVVFSFVASIALNCIVLLVLDLLNIKFIEAVWPIVSVTVIIGFLHCRLFYTNKPFLRRALTIEWGFLRLVLYSLVFIILFYNGGMIDQLSDAWWHMSLTNKIAIESAFTPEYGHLTGAPARYYPPLWHSNLALAHLLSGDSIPVLWNSFTAWGGVLKVMAFYCLSVGLTQNKKMSFVAAFLFVLLPGIGNSYLRVSAWPSHIAYIAWFLMFFVFFSVIQGLKSSVLSRCEPLRLQDLACSIKEHGLSLFVLLGLTTVVYFTHQVEVLWFGVACFAYLAASSISRALSVSECFVVDRDHASLRFVYRLALTVLVALASYYVFQNYERSSFDQVLAAALPMFIVVILLLVEFESVSRTAKLVLLSCMTISILVSLNGVHFLSLFFPDMAVPRGAFHESPSSVAGYFGGALELPGWHLQLRSGLLYSGVLAVPLSLVLAVLRPSLMSLFLGGTALLAITFCLSPYLYHWLKDLMAYHSPWRITLMIFHPLIFAVCLVDLINYVKRRKAVSHVN